jgi:hypothetical protein
VVIGGPGQSGGGIPGDGDEVRADPLDRGEDANELLGLPGVRDGEHHVPLHDHAEITVDGLGWMKKKRRRPCGGECGADLPAEDSRLAEPHGDDAAGGVMNELDGVDECVVEVVDETENGRGFDAKNAFGLGDRRMIVGGIQGTACLGWGHSPHGS